MFCSLVTLIDDLGRSLTDVGALICARSARIFCHMSQSQCWRIFWVTGHSQLTDETGETVYYLRSEKDYQSLAYPPRLAVDLGSYVDGEAHGWAR